MFSKPGRISGSAKELIDRIMGVKGGEHRNQRKLKIRKI